MLAEHGRRFRVCWERRLDNQFRNGYVEWRAEGRHGAEEREFCAFVADAERHDNAAGSRYLAIALPHEAIDSHRGTTGLMGEPARWQERVEEFVLGQIGDPPARVLEVGCGESALARTLARAGHSVTAIASRAPEGTIFRRVRIEEFSDPGPFDYVVAERTSFRLAQDQAIGDHATLAHRQTQVP